MILFQLYTSVKFQIASKCAKLPSYEMWQKQVNAINLSWSLNWLTHGKHSVIKNLFSIDNVYIFTKLTVCVVKWIFCYKEEILMERDPFPAILCQILNILL